MGHILCIIQIMSKAMEMVCSFSTERTLTSLRWCRIPMKLNLSHFLSLPGPLRGKYIFVLTYTTQNIYKTLLNHVIHSNVALFCREICEGYPGCQANLCHFDCEEQHLRSLCGVSVVVASGSSNIIVLWTFYTHFFQYLIIVIDYNNYYRLRWRRSLQTCRSELIHILNISSNKISYSVVFHSSLKMYSSLSATQRSPGKQNNWELDWKNELISLNTFKKIYMYVAVHLLSALSYPIISSNLL